MGTGDVLGTARVIIVADTSGLEGDIAKSTDPAFSKLESDAQRSGGLAGQNLRSGIKSEADNLEGDLAGSGERGGKGLSGGLEKGTSGIKGMLSSLGVPESLMTGWMAAGGAIAAVGATAVDLGSKMQSADAAIATSAGESVKAATSIGNAMLATAGTSEFSGIEMAKAYAAVAGQLKSTEGHVLSAAQAMQVMHAADDLATAKQISLATATSSLATVMQSFQVPVSQAASTTDVLFNASNATGQSVDSLVQAMDRAKTRMGAMAPPISQMGALLVDMANHGQTGRIAMRALGTAFQGLIAPVGTLTKAQQQQQDVLHRLGLSFETASGQMQPIGDIIAQVAPLVEHVGNAEGVATLKALGFGNASAQLLTTIKAGPQAYEAAQASVTKMGSAHAAAGMQSQTFDVQMKILKATFVDLEAQLGQLLIPLLVKLMGMFMAVAGPALHLAEVILQNKVAMDVLGAVMGTVVIAKLAMMSASFVESSAQAVVMAAKMVASGALIVGTFVAQAAAATAAYVAENVASLGIIAGITLLVAAVIYLATHWTQTWDTIKSVAYAAYQFIWGSVLQPIENAFQAVIDFIRAHWVLILGIMLGPFTAILAGIYTYWGDIEKAFSDGVSAIEGFFPSLPSKILGFLAKLPGDFLNLGKQMAANFVSGVINGVTGLAGSMWNAITGGGISASQAPGGVAGPGSVGAGSLPGYGPSSGTAARTLNSAQIQGLNAITQVYRQYGLNPAAGVAVALNESGLSPSAVGDHGTSFGLFQLHQGGALGSHSAAWAENPINNATMAAQYLVAHGGRGMSAAQLQRLQVMGFERPQNPAGDLSGANLQRAISLVGGAGAPVYGPPVPGHHRGTAAASPAYTYTPAQIAAAISTPALASVVSHHASRAVTAHQKALTTDVHKGSTDIANVLAAVHAKSLSHLNTLLNAAHTKALASLESKLRAAHVAALTRMANDMVTVTKEGEKERTTLLVAAAAAAHAKEAAKAAAAQTALYTREATDEARTTTDQVQAISDATAVTIDKMKETGLTGAQLYLAQLQTKMDQDTQAGNAAVRAAQQKVDADAGASPQVRALDALKLQQAQDSLALVQATDKATLAIQQQKDKNAGSAPMGSGVNININGTGMSPQGIISEISWALTTGAVPVAA